MNDDERYFKPHKGGLWSTGVRCEGRWVYLIQDRSLFDSGDAETVLRALGLENVMGALDHYFPKLPRRGRCPTLNLLELTTALDPTNPKNKKDRESESGV